jgi:hypothetical protein
LQQLTGLCDGTGIATAMIADVSSTTVSTLITLKLGDINMPEE